MQEFSISPASAAASVIRYRQLIIQLTWREITGRYRGSFAGMMWTFMNPLLSLAMYTFVFGVVLKARWGAAGNSTADFALVLFAGLLVHSLLAECITRAPYLILGNASYVKQVVFPLEILPVVSLCSALFHTMISLLLLIGVWAVVNGGFFLAVLFIPFLLFPLCLMALGFSWFLAATSVYFRDLGQVVSFAAAGLLFLSPIFYPASAVPPAFRILLNLNPLTFVIENLRGALYDGSLPHATHYIIYFCISAAVALSGYVWFQKIRSGFGDVV